MRLHPREELVRKGNIAFLDFVIHNEDWKQLTEVEQLQILVERIQTSLKYALRAERHPEDPSKPAGLV